MSRKSIIIILSIVVLLAGFIVWSFIASTPKSDERIDKFAQCLSQKGVVMYGAYWCSHCQNQKKLFGQSFKYINYVECTKETQKCQEKDIKGYPTWEFADGSKVGGEMSFQALSEKSSCEPPSGRNYQIQRNVR